MNMLRFRVQLQRPIYTQGFSKEKGKFLQDMDWLESEEVIRFPLDVSKMVDVSRYVSGII